MTATAASSPTAPLIIAVITGTRSFGGSFLTIADAIGPGITIEFLIIDATDFEITFVGEAFIIFTALFC